MQSGRESGFTLVELLVVVAIIAILASLMLPGLAGAKAKTNTTACGNNLRQWGIALAIYAGENEECIPRRGQGVQQLFIVDRAEDWFNALPKAIRIPNYYELLLAGKAPREHENSLFICPLAKPTSHTNFLAYAMNIYLSPTIRPLPHRMSEINEPSTLAFIADGPGDFSSTVPSVNAYSVKARHEGRAQLVFLDGHARIFKGDYLGCGAGDTQRPDVHWQTGTTGVNQSPLP